eukprot:XP_001699745.1 predicted protein [Chlamydomonas reinhardtii]
MHPSVLTATAGSGGLLAVGGWRLHQAVGCQTTQSSGSRLVAPQPRGDVAAAAAAAWGPAALTTIRDRMDFENECPDIGRMEQLVARSAHTWHPVVICAGLNRVVQAAAKPHIANMLTSRYAVNTLWVSAKIGYWGTDGGAVIKMMLERLKAQLEQMREAAALAAGCAAEDPEGAATAIAPALAGPAGGAQDLLSVSADVIKRTAVLDPAAWKPQELANMILAHARLSPHVHDPELVAHLVSHFVAHPGPFKPQAISNVLYALGELFGFRTGGVASAQPGAMTGSYDEEGADGGLPLPPPDLLEQQQTLQLHQQRQPTKPAQTAGQSAGPGRPVRLWKLSPHPDYPQLHAHCRALAALALRQGLGAFNPQELSNLVYACSKLDRQADIAAAMARARCKSVQHFDTQLGARFEIEMEPGDQQQLQQQQAEAGPDGSSAAAAAAQWQLPADPAFAMRDFVVLLGEEIRERLLVAPHTYVSQALSNSLYALVAVGYRSQGLMDAAVAALLRGCGMESAKAQEWTLLLWAIASVRYQPPPSVASFLLEHATTRLWVGSDYMCVPTVIWAATVTDMYHPQLVDWVTRCVKHSGPARLLPFGLTNLLWAMSALPPGAVARHAELVDMLLGEVEALGGAAIGTRGRVQLWQTLVEIEAARAHEAAASRGLDVAGCALFLMLRGKAELSSLITQQLETQRLLGIHQRQLKRMASSQPEPAKPEWLVEALGLRVDIYVWLSDGREVAIEVDGPMHYTSNRLIVKLPRARLRDRQLERVLGRGNLVCVPYWEWDALGTDQTTKCAYLARKLGLVAHAHARGE